MISAVYLSNLCPNCEVNLVPTAEPNLRTEPDTCFGFARGPPQQMCRAVLHKNTLPKANCYGSPYEAIHLSDLRFMLHIIACLTNSTCINWKVQLLGLWCCTRSQFQWYFDKLFGKSFYGKNNKRIKSTEYITNPSRAIIQFVFTDKDL